jgi:hypothetical protein
MVTVAMMMVVRSAKTGLMGRVLHRGQLSLCVFMRLAAMVLLMRAPDLNRAVARGSVVSIKSQLTEIQFRPLLSRLTRSPTSMNRVRGTERCSSCAPSMLSVFPSWIPVQGSVTGHQYSTGRKKANKRLPEFESAVLILARCACLIGHGRYIAPLSGEISGTNAQPPGPTPAMRETKTIFQ